MNTNDGGPAYPVTSGGDCELFPSYGMSLRDWLAGRADVSGTKFQTLNIMAEFAGMETPATSADIEAVMLISMRAKARLRYMEADAMLAERDK